MAIPLLGWGSLIFSSTGKFVCMAHHFILLRLNPFGLRVDREGGRFEHSLSKLQVCLSPKGAKKVSLSWLFHSWGGVVWLWHALVNLYIWLTISSCYGSITLALGLIVRDGDLSILCHSFGFACQQRVLKMFSRPGYLHSKYGVVWIWHPLVNLYIWLTISSCYGPIPLALGLIRRDGGLSTICHSWGSGCQHRVLKTFPCHGYLHSKDQVVWLWHPLVNL